MLEIITSLQNACITSLVKFVQHRDMAETGLLQPNPNAMVPDAGPARLQRHNQSPGVTID
jgi:hypothetical protein